MGGRSVWWKTNLGAVALILEAGPGLVAGVALAAGAEEAGAPTPGLILALNPATSAGPTLDQGESLTQSPLRSLALASPAVAPRVTSPAVDPRVTSRALALTPASHAPRANPKPRQSASPGVGPRRSLPVRSLRAALHPIQRADTKGLPSLPRSLHLPAGTVGPRNPQPDGQPLAPLRVQSPAPDPDQHLKTDHHYCDILK